MANSYSNITVKGHNQESLLKYLEQIERDAYVSPTINGYTIVYDSKEIFSLACLISNYFNCYTLAILNHDESIFHYELYECGHLVDEYISNPRSHDLEARNIPKGGNAQKLCSAFDATKAINKVKAILEECSEEIYTFSSQRHTNLIKALKIPIFWTTDSVGGYEYIQRGAITPIRKKDPNPEVALSMLKKTKITKNHNIFQIES